MRRPILILALLALAPADPKQASQPDADDRPIRLLVRADDVGVAQSVNEACIQAARDGIARSVEVIVPGPWFPDAVRLLQENPGIDVGVHLTLTSEWERIKWRPLTASPSLVDPDGYFFPMTSQRPDFPAKTGFLQSGFTLEDVERELRAQITLALKHLPRVSHLSAHMGAATATPDLRALTQRLAREYKLRLDTPPSVPGWSKPGLSPEQKEQALLALVDRLPPGTWFLLEHPGLDTPELRAIGHKGYENVAADRLGVTRAFLSPQVKAAIARRQIKLISYADLPPTP